MNTAKMIILIILSIGGVLSGFINMYLFGRQIGRLEVMLGEYPKEI